MVVDFGDLITKIYQSHCRFKCNPPFHGMDIDAAPILIFCMMSVAHIAIILKFHVVRKWLTGKVTESGKYPVVGSVSSSHSAESITGAVAKCRTVMNYSMAAVGVNILGIGLLLLVNGAGIVMGWYAIVVMITPVVWICGNVHDARAVWADLQSVRRKGAA